MMNPEIEVGKTYTNGKGRYRKVLKIGCTPDGFTDGVFYELLTGYNNEWGDRHWGILRRFADWAKSEVKEG